jgi:hypothetical protein
MDAVSRFRQFSVKDSWHWMRYTTDDGAMIDEAEIESEE